MGDETPTTAKKPKSLNAVCARGKTVTLVIDSVHDIKDMPEADGLVHEDVFAVLGHTIDGQTYYAGTAEVDPGKAKPAKGETWNFPPSATDGDTFPAGEKVE